MKYFTGHLPATFIYAGIDVERRGVFTGTRGRQLAGRCELIRTGLFPYREEWVRLIAALEATLRLHRHEPGTLPAQARYLHQRTGGMIGSLTHLVRGAAIRAIPGGQEAVTRPLLDTVRSQPLARIARLYWDDHGDYLRDPDGFRKMLRPACRRCTARRGITGPVACHLPPHLTVCRRRRLWTGPAARSHAGQLDVSPARQDDGPGHPPPRSRYTPPRRLARRMQPPCPQRSLDWEVLT